VNGVVNAVNAFVTGLDHNGTSVGEHGSWNRNPLSGYKVIFVPFADDHPARNADRCADRFLNDDLAGDRGSGQFVAHQIEAQDLMK